MQANLQSNRAKSGIVAQLVALSLCASALIGCAGGQPGSMSNYSNVAPPASAVTAFATDIPRPASTDDGGSVGNNIVAFARAHLGHVVAGGECAELADAALVASKARTYSDFTAVTHGDDYVWGTRVGIADARPGDIVQFRGFQVEVTTQSRLGVSEAADEFDHHTAIVEANLGNSLVILEQNDEPALVVQRKLLPIKSRTFAGNADGTRDPGAVTSVRVSGTMSVYRPQPARAL